MGTIPLSNTINITVTGAPSGLSNYAVNSIYLLTNEKPLSVEPYIWAVNAQDIINEYGTDSVTAKMATALFTPSQNLRTGTGQVLVMPYKATNATSASVTTVEITSTIINALKEVTDGEITLKIDNIEYTATKLDFSAISQIDDIITILETVNFDCNIEKSGNKIVFTARTYGTASAIALVKTSEPTGTDLYGADYLNGASATTEAGVNATGETLAEALAQAEEIGYCGGIITTQICENSLIIENATAIQSTDHTYFECTQSLKNIGVLGNAINSAGLSKTRLSAYSMGGDIGTRRAVATYATIAQSSNYEGTDTALTMNLKTLTGLEPDLHLSQTYYNLAKLNGVDIYGSTEGLSVVYSFANGGDYTDEATNALWLKKALEVAGFNYLRRTNTKIPQTEPAMAGLKNAYAQVCRQAVINGTATTGLKWNESIPFGNPEDFQRNIEEFGFYIYSLPIVQQSQAEREERKAPVCQIAIKFAGATHSTDGIVTIQQ